MLNIHINMKLEDIKSRSNLGLEEILILMDNENNVDMYKKLLYFKFKAEGHSSKESYELTGIKKSTAYYLEKQWKSGGYNALIPKPRSGRKSKLTEEQMTELGKILNKKDQWHPNEIINLIKDKWSISYTYSGIKKLIEENFGIQLVNSYDIIQEKDVEMPDFIENLNELSDDNKQEVKIIISHISEEKSVFVLKKLFYLLLSKIGFTNKIASSLLDITPNTGKNWTKQWEEHGYENLKRKKGQGRKKKISEKDSLELKKKLSKRDDWTTNEISKLIKDTTGQTYSYNYLYTLFTNRIQC